jgi:hypothetical protein
MRISFDCREKSSGFFSTTTYIEVITSVVFSEEELAIIAKHRLKNQVVMDRDPDAKSVDAYKRNPDHLQALVDAGDWQLTVAKLMKGADTYICRAPASAKLYQAELTEKLKILKSYIAASVETPQPATIEL